MTPEAEARHAPVPLRRPRRHPPVNRKPPQLPPKPTAPPITPAPPVLAPPASPPATPPPPPIATPPAGTSIGLAELLAAMAHLGFTTEVISDDWTAKTELGPNWSTGIQGAPGGGPWPGNFDEPYGIDVQSEAALSVGPDGLVITTVIESTTKATSGGATTWGHGNVPIGTPQCFGWNMKFPDASRGMWSAPWGLGASNANVPGNDAREEVDFHETGSVPELEESKANSTIVSNYHGTGQGNAASNNSEAYDAGFDLTAQVFSGGYCFYPPSSAHPTGRIDWWVVKPGDATPTIFRSLTEDPSTGAPIGSDPHEGIIDAQVAAQEDSSWHTVPSGEFPQTYKTTFPQFAELTP